MWGQSHRRKTPAAGTPAEPVLPYNGWDDKRETVLYPVPRFRRSHSTAKIQTVKGERVEISRAERRKYYPYLDRLDRRSGTDRCTAPLIRLSILLFLRGCLKPRS